MGGVSRGPQHASAECEEKQQKATDDDADGNGDDA